MDIHEIARAIAGIDSDRALLGALKSQLQKQAPNFVDLIARQPKSLQPFPDPSTITAAQMSLFDNWIEFGGKRPKKGSAGFNRDRWKVSFDIWTQPADILDLKRHRPSFSGVSHLWSGKEITKRASGANKAMKLPKILSQDFRNEVAAQGEQMSCERLGLVYTPDGGYYLYHDGMMTLAADVEELERHDLGTLRVMVTAPMGSFVFEGFDRPDSLPTNCFGHARMTSISELADRWNARLISTEQALN